jgi:hypothetical protein
LGHEGNSEIFSPRCAEREVLSSKRHTFLTSLPEADEFIKRRLAAE